MESLTFSKRDIARIHKQDFIWLMKDHGFRLYENTDAVRVSEYVLQGICFDRSAYAKWVRVIPFVVVLLRKEKFVHLGLGRHLPAMNKQVGFGEWYDFTREEYREEIIADMTKNILEHALPYLADSTDLATLASEEYQEKWSRFWGKDIATDETRLHLYAYTGEKEKFVRTFEKILPVISTDDRDWAVREYNDLLLLKDNLNNPDKLRKIFQEWYQFTTLALNLKKYGIDVPPGPAE